MTGRSSAALRMVIMGVVFAGGLVSQACSDSGAGDGAPPSTPVDGGTPSVNADAADAADNGWFVPHPDKDSLRLYDENTIIDLKIDFAPGEYEKVLAPPGPGDLRYGKCDVTFEGTTVAAACRRKGDPLDWPDQAKPQMVVKFNLTDKAARFHGMRSLNLESFDGLAAPIRDRIGMWMMREAGLDAPRVNHARVFKNGELLGLYMNIEPVDHEFLEDHFGPDATGNLWEEGLELKTNERVNDHARLDALTELVEEEPLTGDHSAFFAALPTLIDVKQVLREMAGETVMLVDDNFSNGSSNFYYYEHPKRGFMVLVWDLDTILATDVNADPFAYWYTSDPNKLRQLMNQNPAWREEFIDDVVEIRDKLLTRFPAETDRVCNQIKSAVLEDETRDFADFEADCAAFKARSIERVAFLKKALGR